MNINFDILDEIAEPIKKEIKEQNKPKKIDTGSDNLILERQAKEQQKKTEFHAAIMKEYQENIRRSQHIRAEINKDIKQGKDPKAILIKAIECISLLTGDKLFYNQNKAALEEKTAL